MSTVPAAVRSADVLFGRASRLRTFGMLHHPDGLRQDQPCGCGGKAMLSCEGRRACLTFAASVPHRAGSSIDRLDSFRAGTRSAGARARKDCD